MEGAEDGRFGKLLYLSLSTRKDVFIFDMSYFGVDGFRWGLSSVLGMLLLVSIRIYLKYIRGTSFSDPLSILGNPDCVKVVHDFRAGSDLLHHLFGLQIQNVFDTMAGQLVVANWVLERKVARARSQREAVRDYLGVIETQLPGSHPVAAGEGEELLAVAR